MFLAYFFFRHNAQTTKTSQFCDSMLVHHMKIWHSKLSAVNGSSVISVASVANSKITYSSFGSISSDTDTDDEHMARIEYFMLNVV